MVSIGLIYPDTVHSFLECVYQFLANFCSWLKYDPLFYNESSIFVAFLGLFVISFSIILIRRVILC